MALGDVLLYLSSILPPGVKNPIQALRRVSTRMLNEPESSHTGSPKDVLVQTDLDQAEIGSLQVALGDKEQEVKRLRRKGHRAAQQAQTELEAANRRLKKAEEDRIAFDQWAQQMKIHLSEAENRVKASQDVIARLSRELHQSQSKLQETEALLDTRSAELRDAQAYLSKLDDVADTEVRRLVDGINSRIFQTAANIADAFQPRYSEARDVQVSEEAAVRLRGLLGSDLLHALNSIHHVDDPLVVQTVLQAAMVSYTRWLCATWNFNIGDPPCLLQHIYQSIRRTGTYLPDI